MTARQQADQVTESKGKGKGNGGATGADGKSPRLTKDELNGSKGNLYERIAVEMRSRATRDDI